MTQSDKHEETRAPAGKPSQAEGERDPGAKQEQTETPGGKPSQAEGDRETVEQTLRDQ
ncbi:MAG TPA: hypothetical protein VFZ66_10545 [Herpetosiphonaceae bacterium]